MIWTWLLQFKNNTLQLYFSLPCFIIFLQYLNLFSTVVIKGWEQGVSICISTNLVYQLFKLCLYFSNHPPSLYFRCARPFIPVIIVPFVILINVHFLVFRQVINIVQLRKPRNAQTLVLILNYRHHKNMQTRLKSEKNMWT